MRTWREVWREGLAPQIPTAGLTALRDALASDDPRLIQLSPTEPMALPRLEDWPCVAADAVGFAFWQALNLKSCGAVNAAWEEAMYQCSLLLGTAAACAPFLDFYDSTPRPALLVELRAEVELALASRHPAGAVA